LGFSEIGSMSADLIDFWASGSIPWVEFILLLVVVNALLLSGGGSKKGLLRWVSKITTGMSKKSRSANAKAATVSAKRKRSSENKGWDVNLPVATPTFKVNSKRKRSPNRESWSSSEIPMAQSSFSVSELRIQSSKRLNKEWAFDEVVSSGVKQTVKPSRSAATIKDAPRVRNAVSKFAPAESKVLNFPLQKMLSPIRIGRRSCTREIPEME